MKLVRFKVRGGRGFPLDMLRYDACWPVDGIAASRMEDSMRGKSDDPMGYEIELAHWAANANWQPTFGRWASFMWHVVQDDGWWKVGEMPE